MSEVVAITGASAGVGRACAVRWARRGASVGLIARGREGLEAAVDEVRRAGGRAYPVVADVADVDEVEAAAASIEAELGELDVWVNNAMATVYSPFTELTPDEFRRVTDVTYLGSVWGLMAALRRMRTRDRGTIVQVGSALAYRGIPLQGAYCGAKHALNGLVDTVRTELLHEGSNVHLTIVQLPAVNTPQFRWGRSKLDHEPQPVPPIYQPEVVADGIYFAAHTRRREVWVGASTAGTIVGNRLGSGLLDRYLARTGVSSQQTEEATPPDRPDNLFDPVEGDFGAHGPFDERAKDQSWQLWATQHRGKLAAAGLAVAASSALVAIVNRDSS
jgi:NAD(P)-dependent dehydrogenase (short-subunit alcohol dehydrogenase family)